MSIIFALVAAILAAYMLFALCSNLIYWYETVNSPAPDIPSLKPGPFACLLLYVDTLSSYLVCALFFILGPFSHRRINTARTQAARPPLILIHGLYNSASVWLYLGRRFRKAGFPVSTFSYHSFFTSPQCILQRLEEHVRRVEAAFPGQRPVFVTHSLGGIFVRHWLLRPENSARTGGLLTLGAPHQGSKLAAVAPGRLAKNLFPAAPFMRELQQTPAPTMKLAGTLPCVALVSPMDEAVLPAANLLPPPGWRLRITSGAGHFSMLIRPSVAELALRELEWLAEVSRHE